MIIVTLGLVTTTTLYDECGLSGHVIGKNLCNIGGYTSFEIGAMKLMGESDTVDYYPVPSAQTRSLMIWARKR